MADGKGGRGSGRGATGSVMQVNAAASPGGTLAAYDDMAAVESPEYAFAQAGKLYEALRMGNDLEARDALDAVEDGVGANVITSFMQAREDTGVDETFNWAYTVPAAAGPAARVLPEIQIAARKAASGYQVRLGPEGQAWRGAGTLDEAQNMAYSLAKAAVRAVGGNVVRNTQARDEMLSATGGAPAGNPIPANVAQAARSLERNANRPRTITRARPAATPPAPVRPPRASAARAGGSPMTDAEVARHAPIIGRRYNDTLNSAALRRATSESPGLKGVARKNAVARARTAVLREWRTNPAEAPPTVQQWRRWLEIRNR